MSRLRRLIAVRYSPAAGIARPGIGRNSAGRHGGRVRGRSAHAMGTDREHPLEGGRCPAAACRRRSSSAIASSSPPARA